MHEHGVNSQQVCMSQAFYGTRSKHQVTAGAWHVAKSGGTHAYVETLSATQHFILPAWYN
jgi:hypothetical protein